MKSAKPGKVPGPTHPITTPVLILVEGDDEYHLVQWMAEHWLGEQSQKITLENVGGKDNFARSFKGLQVRSLGALQAVGVICDSEEDAAGTQQRWMQLFDQVQPKIKPRCHLLQLPTVDTNGAFEALVLQALGNDPVARCAQAFRDCVSPELPDRTQAQKDKIAVQAWLSARMGNAYGNVFKAQQKNPEQNLLNYDDPAFQPIKHFLNQLLLDLA